MTIVVTLQTPRFTVTAYKKGHPSLADTVKTDLEVYIEEAHYPDDYSAKEIARDLQLTLELDDMKIILMFLCLSAGCATTKRVVVNNCTDIDMLGKYKICDIVVDK